MRNGFLAAALIPLAVAGLARAQIGYGPAPAGPGGTYPMWPGGAGAGAAMAAPPYGAMDAPSPGGPYGGGVAAPNYPPPYGRPDMGGGEAEEGGGFERVPNSVFVSTDFLLYWLAPSGRSFPLLTSGTGASLGQPGQAGTSILFDRDFNTSPMPGVRATVGKYFGDDQAWGWALGGFFLPKGKDNFAAQSNATGSPLLARPFFNALTNGGSSLLVAAPGFVAGGVDMRYSSELWGAHADTIFRLFCNGGLNVQMTLGVRYLEMEEELQILQGTQILPGQQAPFGGFRFTGPATVFVLDRFATKNVFAGGSVGAQANYSMGRFFTQANVNVSLGVVHQILDIAGQSVLGIAGSNPIIVKGGLLATSSNIGRVNEDDFGAITEAQVRLGYCFTNWLSAYVGYDFLYLSNVLRPNEQIDPFINPALLPTSAQYGAATSVARPAVQFNQSDAYLHGLTVGVTLRY